MTTVFKDSFYVRYIGEDDDDLIKNTVYPVESVYIEKSYFGLDWPRMYFEFYPTEQSGSYSREIGDKFFIVVQDDFWVIQELGFIPEKGQFISYKGMDFPWLDMDNSITLMRLAYSIHMGSR